MEAFHKSSIEVKEQIAKGVYKLKLCQERKSEVWKNFCLVVDATSLQEKGFVQCKICKTVMRFDNAKTGTSHLKRHKCSSIGEVQEQKKMDTFFHPSTSKLPIGKIKEELLEKIVNFCCKDIRSFEIVAGTGFKTLAQSLIRIGSVHGNVNAAELLPHPTTISRHVIDVANKTRMKVIPEIEAALKTGICSATTDMWTDNYKKIAYTTMTVHYIQDWNLKNRVLFTCDFPAERKTADNIKKELMRRFTKFGFQPELFKKITFVTDQGANIVKALEGNKRLSCCAHVLNTVLRHTFDFTFLQKEATDIYENFINCKSLVTYMKQSGNVNSLSKTLHQEVETRWNTKLLMLMSVYEQFSEIEEVLEKKGESDRLTNIDSLILKNIVALLQPFKDASDELEGDKKPTIQKVLLWFYKLLQHCTPSPDAETPESAEMKKIKERAGVYLKSKLTIDIFYKIATFLWPRFHQLRMLSALEMEEVIESIKNIVNAVDYSQTQDFQASSALEACSSQESHSQHPASKRKKSDFSDWEDIMEETEPTDEITNYVNFKLIKNEDDNILSWWQQHERQFPKLGKLAKQILAIPASSASSERNFSSAGRVIEERRTCLKPDVVDSILFLHAN